MSVVLLIATIVFSMLRDIFSKDISDAPYGTKKFFFRQGIIFLCGSVLLLTFNILKCWNISKQTFIYALIYGIFLIVAQYGYTYAMKQGTLGICSTVYSMGFIFPTLSGCVFWNEALNVFNVFGIFTAIPAIIIPGLSSNKSNKSTSGSYILPLILSMLASGGLGIVQKLQQKSPYPEECASFVIIAFLFAGLVSFAFSLMSKDTEKLAFDRKIITAGGVGAAFALSNILNTILAGQLDSAIFFPVLNISKILFAMALGVILFKDKFKETDFLVLIFGVLSILLLTIK